MDCLSLCIEEVSKHVAKWASNLQPYVKADIFDIMDPISIIWFLHGFMMAVIIMEYLRCPWIAVSYVMCNSAAASRTAHLLNYVKWVCFGAQQGLENIYSTRLSFLQHKCNGRHYWRGRKHRCHFCKTSAKVAKWYFHCFTVEGPEVQAWLQRIRLEDALCRQTSAMNFQLHLLLLN